MIKQASKEAFFLISIAIGFALLVYAVRPDKIVLTPASKTAPQTDPSGAEGGAAEISIEESIRLFQNKGALFADARHPMDFEAGHIQGAVNLYALDPDAWLTDFLATTKSTAVIITYCDGEDCHLAEDLATFLLFNGFDRARYLKNGWEQWQSQGMPVE